MKKYAEILMHSVFFEGLSEEEIMTVAETASIYVRSYEKNEQLLRSGDVTDFVGIILSGSIIIYQDDIWGYRNIMNRLVPGDSFGEIFAAASLPANICAVADESLEALFFNLKKVLGGEGIPEKIHRKIAENFIGELSRKALSFNEKITHMSKRTTRAKLLSYLSSQAIRCGRLSFDIPFDRQQLADYLGVERSAMTVELGRLIKEGLLETRKNHFELHVNALEE